MSPLTFTTALAAAASLVFCSACTPAGDDAAPADGPSVESTFQARLLTCLRENEFTMLAAHRGGFGPGYAENAVRSITRNAQLGVLYAEVDVAQSSDGVLYLMHDWTLDRTTTGSGEIRETAWADIEPLQLVDPEGTVLDETVPTLEDAILSARAANVFLNLDLKNVDRPTLVNAIEALDAEDEVVVIAYTVEHAAELHALNSDLMLSAPNEPDALAAAGVDLNNVYLWLGVGAPSAEDDAALAREGLETSGGLFPLEDGNVTVYQDGRNAGVEILSIDDVVTGARALGGADLLNTQIATCRTRAEG